MPVNMSNCMRIGVDGLKIPESVRRGPLASVDHAHQLGMAGIFFRTAQQMSPTLDAGEFQAIRDRADELGMYLETGLGKMNPYANPETPEFRAAGDGDIVRGARRIMEACAAIDCRELWCSAGSYKSIYRGRWAYDRFRTDVTWVEQLEATERFVRKLAPIARDLGVHLNFETHEEITSSELVRLVESVGPDVVGIVYDMGNGLQRLEHPAWTARRVAPYVRQTHVKDAAVVRVSGGLTFQSRPCGTGLIDFHTVLAIVAAANPKVNLSIENDSPRSERTKPPSKMLIEVEDPEFVAAHPDLSREELADYLALVDAYAQRIDAGEVVTFNEYAEQPFEYAESVAFIQDSATYLRAVCAAERLPLTDAALASVAQV